jgi:molybdenum cofactor cytidylyltransferase
MFAAIILAAGASERMGQPKALLQFRGVTFLEAVLEASWAAGLDRRIVVVGPDGDKVLSNIELSGITTLRNPDPATGPIGSIKLAVTEALNHPVEGAVVWHVDRPHVAVATIQALLDRFGRGDVAIVAPEYLGRRGHPVLFGRGVFQELLDASGGEGARAVVRADPSRVAFVPVNDPAVVEDVDTPEAYRDLLRNIDRSDASPPPPVSPRS